jgi:hypothetical protein
MLIKNLERHTASRSRRPSLGGNGARNPDDAVGGALERQSSRKLSVNATSVEFFSRFFNTTSKTLDTKIG